MDNRKSSEKNKILIHACCTDCLSKILTDSQIKQMDKVVYFYNPNIHPRSEYLARLSAIQAVCKEKDIKIIIADWSPKQYFNALKKANNADSDISTNRCVSCWRLRLGMSIDYAFHNMFTYFTSTLLTSHYMDHESIIEISKELIETKSNQNIKLIIPSEDCCDVKTGGFYKQNYCGCVYSLIEKYHEKFLTSED